MFGTLQCNLPNNSQLNFITDSEPRWVRGAKRRDQGHTSCDFCRQRKVRCDARAPTCGSCLAASAKCTYTVFPPSKYPIEPGHALMNDGSQLHQALRPERSSLGDDTARVNSATVTASPRLQTVQSSNTACDVNGEAKWDDWLKSPAMMTPGTGSVFRSEQDIGVHRARTSTAEQSLDFSSTESDIFSEQSGKDTPWDLPPIELSASALPDGGSPFDLNKAFPLSDPFAAPINMMENVVHDDADRSSTSQNDGQSRNVAPSFMKSTTKPGRRETRPAEADTPSAKGASALNPVCRCLQLMASLLDELAQKTSTGIPQPSIDILFCYLKKGLSSCNNVLQCHACVQLGENDLLLAIAGRYMSTLCERIVTAYVALMLKDDGQHFDARPGDLKGSSNIPEETSRRPNKIRKTEREDGEQGFHMWFDSYRIESSHEMKQVLRCIVLTQVQEFWKLLHRLRTRAGTRAAHLSIVDEAERRMRTVRSMVINPNSQMPPLL